MRVPMLHHEDTNAPDQANLGVLRDRVSRQIVSGMPVSQKVRVESDNQRVRGGPDPGYRCQLTPEFRLELAYGGPGAVHRGVKENEAVDSGKQGGQPYLRGVGKPQTRIPARRGQTQPREDWWRNHQQISAVDELKED